MIILGIDPGLATTGYGIIRKTNGTLKCIDYGFIQTGPKMPTAERLQKINWDLDKLIKKYKPKAMAIENIYFFKNLKTALPVSQAKGVMLLAAAENKLPIYEFTPLQVKMIITGFGRAEKKQVQKMVQSILSLKEPPKPDDASDALAIAICYSIIEKGH